LLLVSTLSGYSVSAQWTDIKTEYSKEFDRVYNNLRRVSAHEATSSMDGFIAKYPRK